MQNHNVELVTLSADTANEYKLLPKIQKLSSEDGKRREPILTLVPSKRMFAST